MLTIVLALSSAVICTAEGADIEVSVDDVNPRLFTISGQSYQFDGTVASVIVWYPGESANSLPEKTLDEAAAYIGEAVVNSNEFTCNFELQEEDHSGTYTVNVFIPGDDAVREAEVDFANTLFADALLLAAQGGTPAELKNLLDTNTIDIDNGLAKRYNKISDNGIYREYVAQLIIENRDITGIPDLITKLDNALSVAETVIEIKAASRKQISNILADEVKVALLGIDLSAYNALSPEKQEKALANFDKNLEAETCVYADNVAQAFDTAVEDAETFVPDSYEDSTPPARDDDDDFSPTFGGDFVGGGTTTLPVPTYSFTDIASVPWASNAIVALADRGMLKGKTATEFYPNDILKREELATIILRIFPMAAEGQKSIPFKDLEFNAYYYDSVSMLYHLGITKGVSSTEFGIGKPVTRQDLVTMLYNVLNYRKHTLVSQREMVEFGDNALISSYATKAVTAFYTAGIIDGVGGNNFAPAQPATRAEAAKIIYELAYKLNVI